MAYKRKTADEFIVQGHYGAHGWEDVTAETTRSEIRERLKEYRANDPGTPYRMIKRRVKVQPQHRDSR